MCFSNPDLPCLQAHHQPVLLEVWSNRITENGDRPWGGQDDLILATRIDLDAAVALVAKMYGVIALATDWHTGEMTYLKTAHKRRQITHMRLN